MDCGISCPTPLQFPRPANTLSGKAQRDRAQRSPCDLLPVWETPCPSSCAMKFSRFVHRGAVAALALGFLALLAATELLRSQRPTGDAGTHNERLLTSDKHGNHNILNSLCKRLLGGAKCEKLSHTGSEVWIVPHSKLVSLEQKLTSLGIRFALLREDWNHILRRNKAPMSTQQEE